MKNEVYSERIQAQINATSDLIKILNILLLNVGKSDSKIANVRVFREMENYLTESDIPVESISVYSQPVKKQNVYTGICKAINFSLKRNMYPYTSGYNQISYIDPSYTSIGILVNGEFNASRIDSKYMIEQIKHKKDVLQAKLDRFEMDLSNFEDCARKYANIKERLNNLKAEYGDSLFYAVRDIIGNI
mgnify:CR=1 FL=1